GHSIDDPEPKYGMAVTGPPDPAALLRIDAGQPGLPLSLTKPIGTGVLNAWHKATGQGSAAAGEGRATLNAGAGRAARAAGIRCATDVTGFGLLGHLFKLARASGVSAVVDRAAVPLIDGTRAAARAGHVPGGSRRNLAWVRPHTDAGTAGEDDLLLLADAQTSGGLLVAGELPGAPGVGELVRRPDSRLRHRQPGNRAPPPAGHRRPDCGLHSMAHAPGLGVAAAGQPVTLALFPDERNSLGQQRRQAGTPLRRTTAQAHGH